MRFTVLLILVLAKTAYAGDAQTAPTAQFELARLHGILAKNPADAFAHYQLGLVYRELGDNRQATVNLQSAIGGGFDNLAARLNLIETAFACRESTLALATAKKLISSDLKTPDVLLRVGRLLFDHLFYQESLRAFELAQQAAPNAFEPRFRLALTYYLLKNYAATVAALKPAEGVTLTPEALSLMASAEAKSGQIETAVSALRANIETAPQSPHAYINLALIDLDNGNDGEAQAILDRLYTLHSQTDAKVFYTASQNSCPQIANALARGDSPVHLAPEKAEFYFQLAIQLENRFNFLSAAHLIRLAQAWEGNSARVLLVAGTSCLNHDPLAGEPVILLREAIKRDPSLFTAYYLLGRAYTRQGKLEEAVAAYQKAADMHADASYYVSLGKALRNRQESITQFKRALALDSSCAQAHLELGRSYVQAQEFGKARPELEKAIELEPDYYEAYYLLGRLLQRSGDKEQSRRLLILFEDKKKALMEQSVISAGYVGEGR